MIALRTLAPLALLIAGSTCAREHVPAPCAPAPDVASEATRAEARLAAIRAERAEPLDARAYAYSNDSWCGNSHVAEHVELAPRAGIVWSYESGFSGERWTNHGDVVESDAEHIVVRWAIDPASLRVNGGVRSATGLSDEIFLVKWGDYAFLVPHVRMRAFCDDFSAFYDPRMIEFPRRWTGATPQRTSDARGDEEPVPEGMPAVPAEFRKFLAPRDLVAHVVAAGETIARDEGGAYVVRERALTLDVGAREGLALDMRLFRVGGGGSGTVVELDDDRAVVRFSVSFERDRAWPDPPEVGALLSPRIR